MHIFCGHINHVSTNEKKKKQIYKYRKHDNRWILCGYAHYSVHSCSRLHSYSCWTQCISICYHEPRVHFFFVSIFRFIIVIGIISSHRAAIRLILIIFVRMMSMQRIGKIQAIKKHWSCSRNKNEKNLLTQDKSTNLFIRYIWEREKNASDRKKENCNINSGKHAIRMDPMSARMYWCHLLRIHSWISNLQIKKSCLVFKYKGDNEYSIALALLLLTILIWFYEHVPLSRSYPLATAADAAFAHIHIHLNISYTNRLYILQYYN